MRLPSSVLLVLALALTLAAPGCQGTPRDAATLLWPDMTDPYVQTTRRWTRSDAVYDGVNLAFAAAATLKTEDWRRAFVDKYAELYGQTGDEAARSLAGQRAAADQGLEVVLALAAPDGGVHRLSPRDERFKVFALSGEKALYPQEIRPMEQEFWPREKLVAFFPYATPWRSFYTLRFQDVPPGPLALVIAGPAGRIELTWATSK
ncbi:hypothetical protein [Desulfocurvus sp.]|jgi:hypothetical protein|uniref:hypothetical protein n=1 Tax=Desulfocurvus sp. TaxID=2871698 RepID=UPI0025BAE22D|nr:hypothetical protein [Desulfocurvus sp.]MCK9239129.1 hypothetical protein [Desulfocurvus sp.]